MNWSLSSAAWISPLLSASTEAPESTTLYLTSLTGSMPSRLSRRMVMFWSEAPMPSGTEMVLPTRSFVLLMGPSFSTHRDLHPVWMPEVNFMRTPLTAGISSVAIWSPVTSIFPVPMASPWALLPP